MNRFIFLNGRFVPPEEAKVSVFDHGFLYGDGCFEGIRAYDGRVFRLDEHVERLFRSAKTLMLAIPYSCQEMRELVLETCRHNRLRQGYIRVVCSRGRGDLGIDPRNCREGTTVVIIADKLTMYPPSMYEEGMAVITTSTRRNSPSALDPNIKSLNYLNNILAKIEVNRAGVGEGIMLNQDGYVAEATGDNVFIVTRGQLITPPTYMGILEGITRNAVIELAHQMHIPFAEQAFTQTALYTADECFLTGTGAEIVPVVRVDDRIIGDGKPGPITRQLREAFQQMVRTQGVEIEQAQPALS
ncbi:MAG: branched-chain-amino-acid transaminase [Armatimonadetes bacterium]|nr:branched-chain-amino-acid transaminase [Armatimonadota bacterium]